MTFVRVSLLSAACAAAMTGATPATPPVAKPAAAQTSIANNGTGQTYSLSATPPIRIRCGGPTYIDASGNVWQTDNAVQYSVSGAAITNTSSPALYQTETWSTVPLTYNFAAPNGSYDVLLKFAEFYFTKPGQRVFNIVANGNTVSSNFDILASSTPNKALDISIPVTTNNGQLTIQLVPVIGAVKIDALQITSSDVAAPPPPPTITTFFATPNSIFAGQQSTLSWVVSGATALTIDNSVGAVSGLSSVAVTPATTTTYHLTATNSAASVTAAATVSVSGNSSDTAGGLGFFPVAPCRIVDTRESQGKGGAFGPPALIAYTAREFSLGGGCGVPVTAKAYGMNITVVPPGPLSFLSAWPAGQAYPGISTLNSPDGSTVANAAIVPAGKNGDVAVETGQTTDVIIDVNGYFAPANGLELAFYAVTPCRIADTRSGQGKSGAFGPPGLAGYTSRSFPVLSSSCYVPSAAKAYSLNITVAPRGPLSFLSIWPSDQPYPGVSLLNSNDGSVIANAAIVPAAANGAVQVVTGNPTDMIIDINGYFAPPGAPGALHFYPLTPCRVVDTRVGQGHSGAFGPPVLEAYVRRDIPMQSSACGIPGTAQAYSLNLTVVPQGPLSFLTAWPAGQPYPNVSTLNSPKGTIIANAAMIPAGTNGSITVIAGNRTDLIVDINGYFAP